MEISSRSMRYIEHVAHFGEVGTACRILIGKSERKGPLGKSRHSWEDNFKMDLKETGYERMGWRTSDG
jgi:hypothetical protein